MRGSEMILYVIILLNWNLFKNFKRCKKPFLLNNFKLQVLLCEDYFVIWNKTADYFLDSYESVEIGIGNVCVV